MRCFEQAERGHLGRALARRRGPDGHFMALRLSVAPSSPPALAGRSVQSAVTPCRENEFTHDPLSDSLSDPLAVSDSSSNCHGADAASNVSASALKATAPKSKNMLERFYADDRIHAAALHLVETGLKFIQRTQYFEPTVPLYVRRVLVDERRCASH